MEFFPSIFILSGIAIAFLPVRVALRREWVIQAAEQRWQSTIIPWPCPSCSLVGEISGPRRPDCGIWLPSSSLPPIHFS